MNRQKKQGILENMKPILTGAHFYIVDCQGLTANQTHQLRGMLHEKQIQCKVLPNALLKLLFKDNEQKGLLPILKESSMLLIAQSAPSVPAKILKNFYKTTGIQKPILKGAFAYGETFLGSNQLKPLGQLKSKEELIGEVITLLQSPITQLLSSIQSGAHKITGVLEALGKR